MPAAATPSPGAGAIEAGFLDEAIKPDALMARPNEVAQQFKQLNMKAHAQAKVKAKADYLELLDRCILKDGESLGLQD